MPRAKHLRLYLLIFAIALIVVLVLARNTVPMQHLRAALTRQEPSRKVSAAPSAAGARLGSLAGSGAGATAGSAAGSMAGVGGGRKTSRPPGN